MVLGTIGSLWYYSPMLNCTWDDHETQVVLRQLEVDKQLKLEREYLILREQFRKAQQLPAAPDTEKP